MEVTRTEQAWVESVQRQFLRGDFAGAQVSIADALAAHPRSVELRRALAGVQQRSGQLVEAEATLRGLLKHDAGDTAAAFALAHILKDQGRTASAAATMRECMDHARNREDAGLAIAAIELLDDCDRKSAAMAIAEAASKANPDDARLHAYAGMLAVQLGRFEDARSHDLFALEHDEQAWEWHVPIGLSSAQHYDDPAHPDFGLFQEGLKLPELSGPARAELHFSLAKAHDDVGDYARAAGHLREGNAIRHRLTPWSRKAWRRAVEARLCAKPSAIAAAPTPNFTPVFIVGMPRTGTTLLAERLARHPGMVNRGEMPWLARLAQRPGLTGASDPGMVEAAAAEYARQARRDDAGDARWFVDKQPLNFRYVDLALAMFPDARLVHCVRNPRDTALSLWMQCFLEDVQGYSYDFADIALVMRDEDRLMRHWQAVYPDSIRAIRYADLVVAPDDTVSGLARWLGLPPRDTTRAESPPGAISTASLWQVRQPVHTRSMGRWTHYASLIPELVRFPGS